MRWRHAVESAWTGKHSRRTGTMAPAGRGSLADRDARPCASFRRNFPAWLCNVPNSPATHPRSPASAARTRDRTVRRRRGSRVPKLGENRGEFSLRSGELREDECLQRRAAVDAGRRRARPPRGRAQAPHRGLARGHPPARRRSQRSQLRRRRHRRDPSGLPPVRTLPRRDRRHRRRQRPPTAWRHGPPRRPRRLALDQLRRTGQGRRRCPPAVPGRGPRRTP